MTTIEQELGDLIQWFHDLQNVCQPFSTEFANFCGGAADTLIAAKDHIIRLKTAQALKPKTASSNISMADLLRVLEQIVMKRESGNVKKEES